MIKDYVGVSGKLNIWTFDDYFDGDYSRAIRHLEVNNLVVTTGKQFLAGRLGGTPPAQMSHMAIGGNSAPPAPLVTDTTLNTEIGRVALTTAGGVSSGTAVTFTATFPAGTGTSTTVTEAGIFNAATNGTMLARTTFAAQNKTAAQIIVISWTITIS